MNPIEKWIKNLKLKMGADKKQNSSSEYHKLDVSDEDIAVFADELAKKNGTTPEEEAGKIHDAIARDNKIEFANYAKKHGNMFDSSMVPPSEETPKTVNGNVVIPQSPADTYAAELNKEAEEIQKDIDGTNEVPETGDGSTSANETENSANTALTDSVTEVTTPKKDDPSDVIGDKNRYNKAMMSIWDAYRNGEISKETAGYFTIDAIATLAKNLGRSIGNVGAQFSGGTIDNGHDESKWGQRQNALLNEEIGKETESLGGAAGRKAESESLDIAAKRIRNAYTPAQLENQIEMFKKDLEMADINLDMAHSRTDLINYIKSDPNYANSPFKMGLVAYLTQAGAAGAANSTAKTLGDAINWILTLAK